jgi:pantoate kinase
MKAKRTTEAPVKDRVKEVLVEHSVQFDMPVPVGYGKAGNFDFICCVAGAYLGIETKRDDKVMPTALQTDHAQEVMRAGGVALLIHKDNVHLVTRAIIDLQYGRPTLSYWPDTKPQLQDTDDAPLVRRKGKS